MQQLLSKLFCYMVMPAMLMLINHQVAGQVTASDADQLLSHIRKQSEIQPHQAGSFRHLQSGGVLKRYNPLSLTFSGLMYTYQRFISPQLPSQCLYHTSCSGFSIRLIEEYGLIGGIVTTADRLMRCNRMAAIDIHPMHLHEQSGRVVETPDTYRRKP